MSERKRLERRFKTEERSCLNMTLPTEMILPATLITLLIVVAIILNTRSGNLNNIKNKRVGHGQHGTARWASNKELHETYRTVSFQPEQWRTGKNLPVNCDGVIVGSVGKHKGAKGIVDTSDSHTLVISAPGGGKTTCFVYPNLEYAAACGMSFLATDTKGDIFENYAGIVEQYYGYKPYVIDLRNPTASHNYNLLTLVNKYMDLYLGSDNLTYKAKAERYAKIIASTVINTGGFEGGGQNAFFYDAAEGVISSTTLLLSELCSKKERHIVSVFKLIQELMETDPATIPKSKTDVEKGMKPKTYFQTMIELLPPDHKAKWLAGAAANTATQSMASVMSTAMSRLLSFIDSDLEQVICFDSDIDCEQMAEQKTAVFIVFPETDKPKHFLVSLLIRQLYDELLEYATTRKDNKLAKRIYFFEDEFGTIPKIQNAQSMFSAGRSRNVLQVPIIQSISQLSENYGRDGADVIKECCQNVLFSFLSPLSKSAKELSDSLGNQTVLSGSVSRRYGKEGTGQVSQQMIQRPLQTADELKSMPKGNWVLQKIGTYPTKTKLNHYEDCGIQLDQPYSLEKQSARNVEYASLQELLEQIRKKYGKIPDCDTDLFTPDTPPENKNHTMETQTISDEFLI